MKHLIAMIVLLLTLATTACGTNGTDTTTPTAQPIVLSPSVDTCHTLIGGHTLVSISGYAVDSSVLTDSTHAWYVDEYGHATPIENDTVEVGTFCSITVSGGLVSDIEMNANPGCYVGWGQNCN